MSRRIMLATAVVAALAVPFAVDDFTLFQLSRVICIGIAAIGLNLLIGHAGLLSAGQGAIFGIGAYTTAILMRHLDVPYLLAAAMSTTLCLLLGLMLGVPALRIRGMALILVTLAIAILLPPVLKRFDNLTGGVFGISTDAPLAPFRLDLTVPQWLYILNLFVLIGTMLFMRRVLDSRFGRAMHAIRTDEAMAVSVGVAVARTKILAFGVCSGLAGLGGGLYQLSIGTSTPDTYAFTLSLGIVFAVVVGGLRSVLGSLLGAAFVVFIPDYTASLGDRGPQLVYATALLVTVYAAPNGIVGIGRKLLGRVDGILDSKRNHGARTSGPQTSPTSRGDLAATSSTSTTYTTMKD